MKNITALGLAFAIALALVGCTQPMPPVATPTPEATQQIVAPSPSPEPSPVQSPEVLDPAQSPAQDMVDNKGTYGYTLTFDPAVFSFRHAEGTDSYPNQEENAYVCIRQIAAADMTQTVETVLATDKKEVALGANSIPAQSNSSLSQNTEGVWLQKENYIIGDETNGGLLIEVQYVQDDPIVAQLQQMLDSIVLDSTTQPS